MKSKRCQWFIVAMVWVLIAGCKDDGHAVRTESRTYTPRDHRSDSVYIKRMEQRNDTVFIKRTIGLDYYHAIFIDPDGSNLKKSLVDFQFKDYDLPGYYSDYNYVKKRHPETFKKVDMHGLPAHWLRLHSYNQKFYLYCGCQATNRQRQVVSDTLIYGWTMDGPTHDFIIHNVKKKSQQDYVLTVQSVHDTVGTKRQILVHVLDTATRMAVWEYKRKDKSSMYELFVPTASVEQFDVIVNSCKNRLQFEYQFEEIDYGKLLRNRSLLMK